MAARTLALAALVAAASVPAFASVQVVGNTNARMCFEAADSPMLPQPRHMRYCDEALLRDNLTAYEVVATHVNRGILQLRRGAVDEAIADFDRAIALDSDQPEAYLNKGSALMRRNNPTEAVRLFTVALQHNTRRPHVAHYGRAIANEQLGNVQAAYRDYRQASLLAPEWEEPRQDLQRFRVVPR
jgi:tetratricopeptide (TPR) repeat protein